MPVDAEALREVLVHLAAHSSPGARLALSQVFKRYGALLQTEGVPMSKQCDHDEANVETLSLTAAHPGYGFATLCGSGNFMELEISPVVAWALVRHDDNCECPRTMVVPLVAGWQRPRLEFPYRGESYSARLLCPGERAVVETASNGDRRLGVRSGDWEPGMQDVAEVAA